MLTHKMRDGVSDDCGHSYGKKAGSSLVQPLSKEESNEDALNKKDDAGIKREREGELLLPVSKRSSGKIICKTNYSKLIYIFVHFQ